MSIAAKLVIAMKAIDAVEKKGRNQKFGYDFVKATDVANEVRKALHEAGIAFTYQVISERFWDAPTSSGGTQFCCSLHIQGIFTDSESGECLTSSAIGWGADSQDKAPYKAMTGALKYLLRTTFLIPDESDPENDAKEAEVRKEVERQKKGAVTALAHNPDADREPPPELDWAYNKASGVLICRILDAKKTKKKDGKGEVVTLKLNNTLDAGKSKTMIYYFHKTHQDLLLASVGKVVKLMVEQRGDFVNVEDVFEVAGEKVELRTSDSSVYVPVARTKPSEDHPETQARLLASLLEISEQDLQFFLGKHGSWSEALEKLKQEKERRESEVVVE